MWLLVIVLLNFVPGLEKVTVIQTFESQQDCLIERDRIGFDMAASYPDEHTFDIVCQLATRTI
jgi:hypothetical protein